MYESVFKVIKKSHHHLSLLSITQSTLVPSTATIATIVPTNTPSGGGGLKGMFV